MTGMDNHASLEYTALMKREQDTDRVATLCWTAAALTAAVTLSWAISARSSGLMFPAVFAIATGFYAQLRGRQQARAIGGYIEAYCEGEGEVRWFGRTHRLQHQPGNVAMGDWLTVCLANAGVVMALVLAWAWADASPHGQLMAGIVTGTAVLFGFHSVSETVRMGQTDWAGMWHQADGSPRNASRIGRAA